MYVYDCMSCIFKYQCRDVDVIYWIYCIWLNSIHVMLLITIISIYLYGYIMNIIIERFPRTFAFFNWTFKRTPEWWKYISTIHLIVKKTRRPTILTTGRQNRKRVRCIKSTTRRTYSLKHVEWHNIIIIIQIMCCKTSIICACPLLQTFLLDEI